MKKESVFFLVVGILVPFVAGFIFLISGGMPVATKGSPLPFEGTIARMAVHAAMGNQGNVSSPVEANEINLISGAKVYKTNCAVCHGTPGSKITAIANGLFPQPPQLFSPDDGVTDDPVGEVYWKIKNGIRLTGMPGFVDELSDEELWQVSLLLVHADKLSEQEKDALEVKNP